MQQKQVALFSVRVHSFKLFQYTSNRHTTPLLTMYFHGNFYLTASQSRPKQYTTTIILKNEQELSSFLMTCLSTPKIWQADNAVYTPVRRPSSSIRVRLFQKTFSVASF